MFCHEKISSFSNTIKSVFQTQHISFLTRNINASMFISGLLIGSIIGFLPIGKNPTWLLPISNSPTWLLPIGVIISICCYFLLTLISINRKYQVILTCGYRRTGKDTFFTKLIGDKDNLFSWRVYKHPTAIDKQIDLLLSYKRIAFADSLKEEAASKYKIPVIIPDAEKDVKQFIHYQTQKLVSSRDIHIEWGALRRLEDIDYWCKQGFKSYINNKSTDFNQKITEGLVVTDWRFHNESEYAFRNFHNVYTIRLYRSDIIEPDITISSEHDLDNYLTDFLLLRDDIPNEYEKALEKFPQYKGYIPCELI